MRFLLPAFTAFLTLFGSMTSAENEIKADSYGQNSAAGHYAEINGIKMYYEIYGDGPPLTLIHGSGQSIAAMKHQIQYFSKDFRVLVADSRAHGKSGNGHETLTYEQMADDWASLMAHVGMKSAYIVGWSDGGNIGLLLALQHPATVGKLATMGANLSPDSTAIYPWAIEWVAKESKNIDDMLAKGDHSQNWERLKQHFGLLREQPNISLSSLQGITAPVLVMAGDRDIIRTEHTVLMYQNLPNAHLAIFPGETHFTPANKPDLFNSTVSRFFLNPFSKPDTRDLF